MKTKTGKAIRELRNVLGLTQGEFAAMIGASKDTVASWEVGRNKLSAPLARRIALATGVVEEDLRRGNLPLRTYVPMTGHVALTRERFAEHRKSYWGGSDEAAARRHFHHCADALELILMAAARNRSQEGRQLPAVWQSFIQWCEETREEFQLGEAIDELLGERKKTVTLTKSYREWRRMAREDPTVCRGFGFKDDSKKEDTETLSLSAETLPLWRPGHAMRKR